MKDLQQFEAMHEAVEKAGDAGDYRGQAREFLKGTGATIEGRFIGMQKGHFGDDDDVRDRWEIRITRNGRTYTFKYGNSIHATEKRIASMIRGEHNKYLAPRIRKEGNEDSILGHESLMAPSHYRASFKKWADTAKEWHELKQEDADGFDTHEPTPYDILAGVTKYEPEDNVDDFASSYGIEKPSEALRVYKAVCDEYQNMRALFDNDELETLALIS